MIISLYEKEASQILPRRDIKGNKGTFGKVFAYVGSEKYKGAMLLAMESALRGGAGYTNFIGSPSLCDMLLLRFPEVICHRSPDTESLTEDDISAILKLSESADAFLIGAGCGISQRLANLTESLIRKSGKPLIIDADALNSLARYSENGKKLFQSAKRQLILTPHSMELSRICGLGVSAIEESRVAVAEAFAKENSLILLLKGYRTVITDGERTFINTSGSSALAKGGSGDCLAGLISLLIASSGGDPLELVALSAYVHGSAADNLSDSLSTFGVTPSDLPIAMAKVLSKLQKIQDM